MGGRGSPTGIIELPTNYSHFARIPTFPALFYPQKTSPSPPDFGQIRTFFRPGFPLSRPITPPPIRLPAPPRRPPRSGPQPSPASFPPSFPLLRILPNSPPFLARFRLFSLQYFGFPQRRKSAGSSRFLPAGNPHHYSRKPPFSPQNYSIFTLSLQQTQRKINATTANFQCKNTANPARFGPEILKRSYF